MLSMSLMQQELKEDLGTDLREEEEIVHSSKGEGEAEAGQPTVEHISSVQLFEIMTLSI